MSVLSILKVPVFKAGGMPDVDIATYQLHVTGLVNPARSFAWNDILAMPKSSVDARLTSVSGFSVRSVWEGVIWRDFLKELSLESTASHVTFSNVDATYETTIALQDLDHPRVLLCYAVEGEPLEREYGGPLRMIVPNLWGYKSCKWLETIRFIDGMQGGYWEDRGYTRDGVIEAGFTMDINTKQRRPISGGEVTDF